MEDFHLREKITHFDHERIPERVVHARGSGAYGHFTPHESLAEYTTAEFRTGTGRATRRTCPPDGARAPRGGAGWTGGRGPVRRTRAEPPGGLRRMAAFCQLFVGNLTGPEVSVLI
jgi:hypothetical protein